MNIADASNNTIIEVKLADIIEDKGLIEHIDEENVRSIMETYPEFGLINPVLLSPSNKIISGRHRYLALKRLGAETVPAVYMRRENIDERELEIIENTVRRELRLSDKVAYAKYLESKYKLPRGEAAKKTDSDGNSQVSQMGQMANRSIDKVLAFRVFENKNEYYRAKSVIENGIPELVEAVENGAISLSAGASIAKLPKDQQMPELESGVISKIREARELQAQRAESCRKKRIKKVVKQARYQAASKDQYSIIYANPPWETAFYEGIWTEADAATIKQSDLLSLPVDELSQPISYLFLRCPPVRIPEALECIDAWGFTYATNMVWVKGNPEKTKWTLVDHEHLLIASKGSAAMDNARPACSVIKRNGLLHGRTPEEYWNVMENYAIHGAGKLCLFPPVSPRKGWDTWKQ